jgi:hypothetical protein
MGVGRIFCPPAAVPKPAVAAGLEGKCPPRLQASRANRRINKGARGEKYLIWIALRV